MAQAAPVPPAPPSEPSAAQQRVVVVRRLVREPPGTRGHAHVGPARRRPSAAGGRGGLRRGHGAKHASAGCAGAAMAPWAPEHTHANNNNRWTAFEQEKKKKYRKRKRRERKEGERAREAGAWREGRQQRTHLCTPGAARVMRRQQCSRRCGGRRMEVGSCPASCEEIFSSL